MARRRSDYGAALTAAHAGGTAAALKALQAAIAAGLGAPAPSYANFVPAPGVSRAESYGYATISNGTDTGTNLRRQHVAAIPLSTFRVKFPGWGENGSVETDNPNDVTVRAAVEYPSGTFTPIFFGGKRDIVIQPGATATSDTMTLGGTIPAGAQFWTRTYLTVASAGMTWRADYSVNAALGEACSSSAAEVDQTTSGTISGVAKGYAPVSIVNEYTPAAQPVVFLIGDSIAKGATTTSAQGGSGQDLLGGLFERAFSGVLPLQRSAIYGIRASQFATPAWSRRQWALATGANCALVQLGINDVNNGRTLAQTQADLLTIWTTAKGRGMRVWQTTITPSATSTDSYATLVNQTPSAGNTARVALNGWIRAGAPIDPSTKAAVAVGTAGALLAGASGHPLYSYVELADTVESSRDSGSWKAAAGYTTDGTHPTAAGHAALAGALAASTFKLT